jgi:hypothetical protein
MIIDEKVYDRIKEKTCTDYEGIRMKDYGVAVNPDAVKVMLEDLLLEIGRLEEEIEDIIRDRDDNWKPISIEEQVE